MQSVFALQREVTIGILVIEGLLIPTAFECAA